ncbi:AIM24 family protein (plasmid) [Deinococcus taeanensis]|uniref:AIM24 family protein n=1 Tax=Deinococcus taeanensis TaxID=2737050 RepID=UPI001CDCA673|nr:AIM24 family protein [Deinococcus taeanensis]UBV44614.1 AIM24 family protein [Deinococcus taeanensis]
MSYRVKLSEESSGGLKAELYAICKVTSQLVQGSASAEPSFREIYSDTGTRQVRFELQNDSVILEPGILSYAHGALTFEVVQQQQGNFLQRAARGAGSGESAFGTRISGTGEVWTEPTRKHFIFGTMEGHDSMLIDDKAYYAAQGTRKLSTHQHSKVQGAVSGNGLMQPRLDGTGLFVIECPVSVHEVEVLDVPAGHTVTVDGDMMLMYTATMNPRLGPLVRGLRNAARSGEGLVYTLQGPGQVFLTPTYVPGNSLA